MRSYKLYLNDLVDAMRKILEYTKGMDYEDFIKNSMIFDAVIRNFEIIGEAAKNIPNDIQAKLSDIPWSDMVGMRNILIHGYFGVDDSIIWTTIELLPPLIEKIARVQSLEEAKENGDKKK